jgi:hypothetical protein
MSPETSAPRPPTAWALLPPLAPKTSSEYSPLTSTGKLCTAPVNTNVSAFASAAQASIARAETPASNIALDLIMRFPRSRLPLSGRLGCKAVHSIIVTVNPESARGWREIGAAGEPFSSWPGLTRPSTPSRLRRVRHCARRRQRLARAMLSVFVARLPPFLRV